MCKITYKRDSEAHSSTHQYGGRAVSVKYVESLCEALIIYHAKRMRRIILLSVFCSAVPKFYTLSHKQYDNSEKILLNKKGVFLFPPRHFSGILCILDRVSL